MFVVYMLLCGDGSYYIGHTDDLERRMVAHADNTYGGYTAERHPLRLVWHDEFATRWDALERERQLKGWSRGKKEALIRGDWNAIHRQSRSGYRPSTRPALRAGLARGERGRFATAERGGRRR